MGQGRLEGGEWREGPSSLEKRNRGRGREGGRVQKLVVMLKNTVVQGFANLRCH